MPLPSCSRARKRFRAYDSTLAFARRKIPGVRHRFSPLFISPLRTVTALRGRNALSEKSGRFPAFPNVPSGPNRFPRPFAVKLIVNGFSVVAEGMRTGDSLLMEQCRERGKSPCFEHFVSERRQPEGWNGRRECDSVRNLWLYPELIGNPRTRVVES